MLSTHSTPLVHLRPELDRARPSPTLAFNENAARLKAEGRPFYQLGFGQSPFPVPDRVADALRDNAARSGYLPVRGLPELRDAVAAFHRRFTTASLTRDDVLIGPGSKELIFLLQLAYQAELLVPSPSWVSYEPQARLLGHRIVQLPAEKHDRWHLSAETFDAHCRAHGSTPRLLILNSPNNPTGLAIPASELESLARVAERHRVLVLSDEIYGELHHDGQHRSIAEFYPEGTIISSGLSKWCSAGGWRLGCVCVPPSLRWLLDAMAMVASETYSSASTPVQYAAVTAFAGGPDLDRYLFQARRVLRALGHELASRLRATGVDVHAPDGGFYLFPDFTPHEERLRARGIDGSHQLCERLLEETGVGLLPGGVFGRPAAELTCRLAYVNFDGAACLRHAGTVADNEALGVAFLEAHCRGVLEAVDRIREWLA